MKKAARILPALMLLCLSVKASDQDPLPSWNEGESKQAIMDFVQAVTDKNSSDFVPEPERICTFDNDGTLWSEQPYYFQLAFALDRVKQMAPDHPEWKTTQPFKAVIENDLKTVIASGKEGLMKLIMVTHAGMTTEEFETVATEWMETARHPRFQKKYNEMVYQPMLELLSYLRSNGFKTYIVSGGGIEFMRPWTEKIYGIPPEQVVGSSIKTKYEVQDGVPVIVRLPEIDFIDDKVGKPVGINSHIGRRPIAAFGNSDGDYQMLEYTTAGPGKRFGMIIHHTDGKREWAYDKDSHIGQLSKGLDDAPSKGWVVVDMKKDWKVIYPFELKD